MSITENLKLSPYVTKDLAEKAKQAVQTLAWPTTRMEHWKYTRVSKLQKLAFNSDAIHVQDLHGYAIQEGVATYFFVNGHFVEALNQDKLRDAEVRVLSESNSKIEHSELNVTEQIFEAINTAFLADGIQIQVAKKAEKQTVQIIHILSGDTAISNFKTEVKLGDFAEFNLIQGFYSTNDAENCFANISNEYHLGVNSKLLVDKVQFENEASFHINSELVNQAKDSHFRINTITLNGGLVRNNLNIRVSGENCTTDLFGAYVLKGKQHVDNHTVVDHKVANCLSNELYKGVIDDSSTAVFNGKVFVRQDAQKINAFQSNGNVLLSDDASVNSKPELEIYADDVKCSHGSTTGQLDDEAIFYLEARGISKDKARALLVSAFIGEALENIENEAVLAHVHKLLEKRFGWNL